MKKFFCCECGADVTAAVGVPGRCVKHPAAKRYPDAFARSNFKAARLAVESAPAVGVASRGDSYWQIMDRRAAVGKVAA